MSRAHEVAESGGKYVIAFHCPGCGHAHTIDTNTWTWDGDLERPTFTPSVLVRSHGYPHGIDPPPGEVQVPAPQVCHSFVTDGRIQFLGDCTHALAGQTIDLPEWSA